MSYHNRTIYIYIYIYTHTHTPISKTLQFEYMHEYINLLFSHQKEKTKGVYISYIFSNYNVFENGCIHIYL